MPASAVKQADSPSAVPATPPADLVGMGYVAGAFGVHGWVKVRADTEYLDSLFDYPCWWLKQQGVWQAYSLLEGAVHNKGLIAKLAAVTDRDQAAVLRGAEIAVSRALMPQLEEDAYYWTDLLGLTVINAAQQTLGQVKKLLATGANDVLVVQQGEVERLIPFVAAIVHTVDLTARVIRVDWEMDF